MNTTSMNMNRARPATRLLLPLSWLVFTNLSLLAAANADGFTSTTTALTSSVNPSAVGQRTVLTAFVTPTTAIGTITFKDGSATLGTAALSAGKASLSYAFTSAGSYSLIAVYTGDGSSAGIASATLNQNVSAPVALPAAPVSPGPVTTYAYDAQGNRTQTIVAPGVPGLSLTTTAAYDALNRVQSVIDAANGSVQLGYDGEDKLTLVTDPNGLVTQVSRNGLGQVQQLNSPDTGLATLSYDAAGNLSLHTDSRGVTAGYGYDALNRLTSATYSQAGQGSRTYEWAYDQTGAAFSYGIGRLTTGSYPEGNTRYAYDAQGRVVQAIQTVNPAIGGNNLALVHAVTYGYDAAGHRTSLIYPSGRQIVIGYANGLPATVSLAAAAGAAAGPLMTNLQYAPFGPLQSWNWAMSNGPLEHARLFDIAGRLMRYPLGNYLRDLRYDAAGRITGYTHYLASSGAAVGAPAPALDQQFAYDSMGRLIQATTASRSWAFTYDANGNRTSAAVDGGAPAPYTIDVASNRVTALTAPPITLSYDAAGNALADGNYTLGYDLRGRLADVEGGGTMSTYTYDNAGQRVRKYSSTGAGSAVVFVYDPNSQLLGEYDANGAPIREYVWLDNMPVAVITPDPANALSPPQVYYIHADHLNTPRVVVDTNNATRWSWFAEPFGTTKAEADPSGIGSFTFNLRFPGQFYDAESGMHYNYFRDYIPGIGRYAQSDPIGLAGGINTYSYVGSNPLSDIDPSGLYTEVIQWGQSPGFAGSWGHITGNINGQNFSFGPGGWDTRFPRASEYADRQSAADINREGRGTILSLSPAEEARLASCVKRFESYSSTANNCGRPWLQCLDEMGITQSGNRPNILPSDVMRKINSSPRAIGATRYPGSRPLYLGR